MKTKLAPFIIALAFSVATLTVHATDIMWTNTASGNWSTAANWSPNQIPGAADNAYITNHGTYTVTVNANASPGTLTIGGTSGTQTLSLSAGIFTLNGSDTGNAQSALIISGGTFAGSGELTIYGALSGAGKTIIAGSGSLSLSGTTHYLNRVLQNDGTATWTVGMLSMTSGSFNNNGSFTASASGPLDCRGEVGVNVFNNTGTFTQQGAGTTSVVRNFADVSFNNRGTVNIRGGTLSLMACVQTAGLTLLNGGALSCSSAMLLQGGTLAGTNRLTGSVNNTGGILSAGVSPGKLTITGNYVQGSGGAMTVELGGTTPGAGFDQVAIGGSLQPSAFSLRALGQSYSIDWYKTAGGGGTSTGGVYTVSGTIGQPEASGPLTGGGYSLTGGFWAVYLVQTPGAPTLTITRSGNSVIVSWPNTGSFMLQQNASLAPAKWVTSGYSISTINGMNSITINSPTGNLFFRLKPP